MSSNNEKELAIRDQRENEALMMVSALISSADKIISVNLTQNYYYRVLDENFRTQQTFRDGDYDSMYQEVLPKISEEYREAFAELFNRETLLQLYEVKEKNVYLEYKRMLHGEIHWCSSHVMYTKSPNSDDVCAIIARRDIDALKTRDDEQKKQLTDALAMAEKANRAKSAFLFNTSHDIRTPMNAIQGFARMIDENYDNPALVKATVHKILQSSDTLMDLLNDVLELSRIEEGKTEIEEIPFDMLEHTQKNKEMFAAEMQQAGLNFILENHIEHSQLLGDELKLSRIALNLLSNAKKFTPRGGTVTFGVYETEATEEQAMYHFFVRDTGIGMSQEFQMHAYEEFERERTATESGVSGSGLGLAISKKLCDLMQGDFSVKSELGKGTEFTVSIPFKFADTKALEGQENHGESYDYTGKRVLLVEDNEFNREIARYILENINMEVEEAENGSICVDKLLKAGAGYYDLVLMDIQMPIMDGYTATREIRAIEDKELASIPIIAMTANAFKEDKEKCLSVGMDAHLAKPLDAYKLIQTIKNKI